VDLRATSRTQLERAREHTLAALEPLDDADLARQVSPLMSPLCWDLAHVAHYEELWLLRSISDAAPTNPAFDDLYDAFRHPRRERASLDILSPEQARRFARDVRSRVLDTLATVRFDDGPLLRDAFVYGMVIQHEHQHRETMLATIELMDQPYPGDTRPSARRTCSETRAEVRMPGGTVTVGTDTERWAYDNERPAHQVELAPFYIDVTPVTNDAYATFVDAGGYDDPRLWTDAGWAWRTEARLDHPAGWHREGADTWSLSRFGHRLDLDPREPVQHVCWYEADAFARWAGKRLPTEAEWELAASDGADGPSHRYPWGDDDPTADHANLGGQRLGPSVVDAHPAGASPAGVLDLIGDVWEWTATPFDGYPGFRSFPYREYSEVFFGDEYRVLRGGSWATDPAACRATFRNWDYPIRRQIFSGFRCARDG